MRFTWRKPWLCLQSDRMRCCDASIRGGQHIPQISHHHQVLPEDVEQRQRHAHLHLPGRVYGGRAAQLELDLRDCYGHSLPGGSCSGWVKLLTSGRIWTKPVQSWFKTSMNPVGVQNKLSGLHKRLVSNHWRVCCHVQHARMTLKLKG